MPSTTPTIESHSFAAVDETAQIETSLTEGLRTLQVEVLPLSEQAPCDLIARALMSGGFLGGVS